MDLFAQIPTWNGKAYKSYLTVSKMSTVIEKES